MPHSSDDDAASASAPSGESRLRRMPRWLARAPIVVFRLGLGGLFAHRLVMVDHLGRRSGKVRQVVLERVAQHGPATVVVAGYGNSSQWLRNVAADPRVRLWRGSRRPVAARAEILTTEESARVLETYRRDHPVAARGLAASFGINWDAGAEQELAQELPAVRFTPRDAPGTAD